MDLPDNTDRCVICDEQYCDSRDYLGDPVHSTCEAGVRRDIKPENMFDQQTLDALASLPQPPEDDECERRWD